MSIKFLLERMLRHCDEIKSDSRGLTFEQFCEDGKTQRAVFMSLHQIGELAVRLPEAFRNRHNDIPWRGIRQIRNIISHEYIRIDLRIVWETVSSDIPELLEKLQTCLTNVELGLEPEKYDK